MMIFGFLSPMLRNSHFFSVIRDHSFLFVVMMLVFAFCVILVAIKLFVVQLILFAAFFIIEHSSVTALYGILLVVQILFGLFVMYRYKKAIDFNYQLVLEKTHQTPPKITKNGHSGSKFPFY